MAVYDPIEDAHSIWATNKDTTSYPDDEAGTGAAWLVDDILYLNGYMHAAVRGHGNFISTVTYRDYIEGVVNYDVTPTDATGATNTGFIVSSLYDGGTPGLKKLWRMASVEAFIPAGVVVADVLVPSCTVELQYSIDRGTTWTSLGTISETVAGTYRPFWYMSTANAEVVSSLIQYRLVCYSGVGTATPTIKSVSFWYLPEPEPNWVYDLTVGIAEESRSA